jgi:hypothetical protein
MMSCALGVLQTNWNKFACLQVILMRESSNSLVLQRFNYVRQISRKLRCVGHATSYCIRGRDGRITAYKISVLELLSKKTDRKA